MFSWITHTVNPLGGVCPFNCYRKPDGKPGCWAKILIEKYGHKKYSGSFRIIEKELRKYPDGAQVFVCDMLDLGAPSIPASIIMRVLQWIREQPKVTFLLLTKEPRFFATYAWDFPPNIVIGSTIETNRSIPPTITAAPDPDVRFRAMNYMRDNFPHTRFLSIEPIMDFDLSIFASMIIETRPAYVAIGYDNYNNGLPEPPLSKTLNLIKILEDQGIKVYRKTLREAHG